MTAILKRTLSLLPFLLAAFLAVGCSGRAGRVTVKLSSWGDAQENAILSDLAEEFEKIHPEVRVELQRVPADQYVSKLLTQIAGGDAPDVVFCEVGNFTDLYLHDILEPLDSYVQAGHLDLSAYYPQVVDRFTIGGRIYVIPRDTAPICAVYYNKKAFDEAGLPYPKDDWTLDEFLEAAQKVMKRDARGNVIRWGFVDDWPMPEAWIYDFGGSYADDVKSPTRWTFASDPHALQGVRFRADLINRYKVMLPPSGVSAMGGIGTASLFENGTAAMFLSGIWKTPYFRQIKDFTWDVAMLPKGPGGLRAFSTGGSGYGIMRTSRCKQEAWQLVQFLSGEDGARKFASTGFAQPALMKIADSPAFLDGQPPLNKKMLLKAVKYVRYPPVCKNWHQVIDGLIGPELDKVWNGTESPERAMVNLGPVLEKNRPQVK